MAKLLLVDDDKNLLKSFIMRIEEVVEDDKLDWQIFTAYNEDEARELIENESFDVIITDLIMLQDKSGFEVIKTAQKKDSLTQVIVVTAFEKKLERYEAFELGAFDCIIKGAPGVETIDEIIIKTKIALRMRVLALNEAKRKRAPLESHFDPKVLQQIDNDPELLKMRKRYITIVFFDIRGFTKLCDQLRDDRGLLIPEFLKEFFNFSSEIIFQHGGVLDKFIGDAVMALFGAFNGQNDNQNAVDAVNAATDILKRFKNIIGSWQDKFQKASLAAINPIELGCGIHSGDVLVGKIETNSSDQFTAFGHHVNIAQRIESHSGKKKGNILVSPITEDLISSSFNLEDRGEIEVKNINDPIKIYEVIR